MPRVLEGEHETLVETDGQHGLDCSHHHIARRGASRIGNQDAGTDAAGKIEPAPEPLEGPLGPKVDMG